MAASLVLLRALIVLSLQLVFSPFPALAAVSDLDEDGRLIGYQEKEFPMGAVELNALSKGVVVPGMWVEHISWEPRAVLYHNFLTPFECLYLIRKASPQMRKSQVVDNKSGQSVSSEVRTSSGTFLARQGDDVIKRIEERIAHVTHVPVENGEPLHILEYEIGQEYKAHYDYFHDTVNVQNGGQRIATMLMYLSDVEEGGETTFPAGTLPKDWPTQGWSKCAEGQLAVRPRRGDALLFWSLKADATVDPASLHSGCPVIKGLKWSATKWMRVGKRNER